jgi:hypothetical protein
MLWGDHWGEPWGGPLVPSFDAPAVRGEQVVRIPLPVFSDPFNVLEAIDSWSISPSPPLIAAADVEDDETGVLIYFDRRLSFGVTYTLTLLTGLVDPWIPAGAQATFTAGKRAKIVSGELAGLLDIDAPIVRRDGRPGGVYSIGEDGDYKMSGGAATIIKLAWDAVLTVRGELSYDPTHGSRLRHKRPAALGVGTAAHEREIVEALEAVPYVDTAKVRIEVGNNEGRISWSLGTRFGRLTDAREVRP